LDIHTVVDIYTVIEEVPMDGSFTPKPRGRLATLAALEAQITELAGQLNAAQYRWLMLIAEFDRLEG
jgi:hypothetical protein